MESKAMVCTSKVKLKLECKRKYHESVAKEVLQLKKRLTHLEEETSMLKQELVRNIAERKTLFNEVYRKLKVIQFSLHPQEQAFGNKCYKVIYRNSLNFFKTCKQIERLDKRFVYLTIRTKKNSFLFCA